MSARRQQPEARRQDLIRATVSCLARLGPRGATGREICREAGVSHGLLRHYFDNPDNLLLETYERLCDQLLAQVERDALAEGSDPWAALHQFFVSVFSEEWVSPDMIGAWMVFWQLVRTREDFAEVSARFNERQRVILESLVRRLPGAGDGFSLEEGIAILSAVLDGLWIDFYISETRTPRDRAVALCDRAARRLFT